MQITVTQEQLDFINSIFKLATVSAPVEVPAKEVPVIPIAKEESTIERYTRLDFESMKTKAKYNYQRVGISIINRISDIPVLVKGDKGVKDERKIDIKCAIAKVLGYYVKGKQVFSPHHTPLTNKITYKFKKGEPNYGEQLQLEANDFRQYLVKLQFHNEFEADLKNDNTSSDSDTPKSEKEVVKAIEKASKVVDKIYIDKPTKTVDYDKYEIDYESKKIKTKAGLIPSCIGYSQMSWEQQNNYCIWWFEVGQKKPIELTLYQQYLQAYDTSVDDTINFMAELSKEQQLELKAILAKPAIERV